MTAASYWELALAVPEDAAEGLTNFLWELGALGVVEEARPPGAPELRAFFAGTARPAALRSRVRAYAAALRRLGFPPAGPVRVTPLEDGRWAEAWREHFRPRPVGRRFLVAPPWQAPPDDPETGRLTIVIEPARAFGTGHHGSTAGCLLRLEALAAGRPPATAIDLGTGSGVLAIAAARLGVARVLAVDADPDAVAAAARNAALNAVADRVACRVAEAETLEAEPAGVVLANLLAAAHLALAPRYARWVAPGGVLVLGGLLDAEAAPVAAALAAAGLVERGRASVEGWTTLELRRAGAPLHDRA